MQPIMKMRVQNYHVDKTGEHEYYNPNTQIREKRYIENRVNTHVAWKNIDQFKIWVDTSPDPQCLEKIKEYMRDYSIVNVVVSNKITFAPGAYKKYRKIKYDFIRDNLFDEKYDYAFVHSLYSGYTREFNVIKLSRDGGYPWYTYNFTQVFLDLIFLGWFQRIIFENNRVRVHY